MGVYESVKRVDAYDKATGRAKYTDDLTPPGALVAKIVRSTIANGKVLAFDLHKAQRVPGVVRILTCFDVPEIDFSTGGHPWSTDPAHQDVMDRRLLNQRVRVYGEDIAVVIAETALAAEKAAALVGVKYEEYPAETDARRSYGKEGELVHEEFPDNLLKKHTLKNGEYSFDELKAQGDVTLVEGEYNTPPVQHCHIELPTSYAYMENGRIVIVASTQVPHIVRRVTGQALGIPFGMIRVIKPYLGGGFGNKQDVLNEPLNAWLTTKVGGRCVRLDMTREETFTSTRIRHPIDFIFKTAVRKDGRILARKGAAYSNQGGYASCGHAVVANAANTFRILYQDEIGYEFDAHTIYTNIATAGAMRGYGIPQVIFALESHIDDVARAIGMDPLELRMKNCVRKGYVNPGTGITAHSDGLMDCLLEARKAFDWDKKRAAYQNQSGPVRRGVGMACFSYKSNVHPISLETSSVRMVLNQDGSVGMQMGATEIGQGADTVFTQMAAQELGLPEGMIHILSTQDTDVTPFDTGAYASRQTYVCGQAVKQTAGIFKAKVLEHAAFLLEREAGELDVRGGGIVEAASGKTLFTMGDFALEALYGLERSRHITAESTFHCKTNSLSFGLTLAEVEVDIPVGVVRVLDIMNIHDSGKIINPQLAEGQVHGGMSMGLGYALSEQLLYDQNARLLNGNLLDYKLPTSLDTPELNARFVETVDPTGPYGNKSLGEPPCLSVAPAVRNAVLHATGVSVNSLPMNPQKLVEAFTDAGLIAPKGGKAGA